MNAAWWTLIVTSAVAIPSWWLFCFGPCNCDQCQTKHQIDADPLTDGNHPLSRPGGADAEDRDEFAASSEPSDAVHESTSVAAAHVRSGLVDEVSGDE